MRQVDSLSHSRWECKYHGALIPKYRKKAIFGRVRSELGEVLRQLAEQKESRIEEGHRMPDHVHRMVSIPPKYAVAQVIGYIKGKSAIHIQDAMPKGSATLWVSPSGPEGILFQPPVGTKP